MPDQSLSYRCCEIYTNHKRENMAARLRQGKLYSQCWIHVSSSEDTRDCNNRSACFRVVHVRLRHSAVEHGWAVCLSCEVWLV